jgi:ATP-dependent protease ClpP protease subunit
MTEASKPDAVKSMNGRTLPGKPAAIPKLPATPRGIVGRVNGRDRPKALPVPAERRVSAFTNTAVMDKWAAESAGVRAVETGDNVITMFDVIGEDYWSGGGITAKAVTAQLRAIGDRPVEVQINSPGGDMFEGLAIYNVLREHPQNVTIKVMGMAASAASVIAMAGDDVQVGAASFIMIHNCWVMAIGNRNDMIDVANYLAPFDQAMAEVYAFRTKQDVKDVTKWMDAETYMSGSTAIDRGFADSLLSADKTKVDEKARANDRHVNELRAVERTLIQAGLSREDARARVESIRGKRDAAQEDAPKRDAGGTELIGSLAGLLDTFR